MENMKVGNFEVVYIKEELGNISALNPIDLNIQDEEDEIGDKSEHKVYCSLTVVNPEEITYDSLGSDDYNSDWVFGPQTSEGNYNQQLVTVKNESSQQSVIECDLSNDSSFSRLNDNSSSDNSNMYAYFSLPNESPLVSFSLQESTPKRIESNDWNNKHVPEQKKVVTKPVVVTKKVEKPPPVKKTFACPICNKVFASKSNLERHGVVHSDVKPFQCVECKRMFSRRVHLERHKFLHMDQKPFSCEVCKRGFTQKTHLEKHQYVHTGVKPFNCPFCEKSFARKESLNRHKGIHAANEKKDITDGKESTVEKKGTVYHNGFEKKENASTVGANLNQDNIKTNNIKIVRVEDVNIKDENVKAAQVEDNKNQANNSKVTPFENSSSSDNSIKIEPGSDIDEVKNPGVIKKKGNELNKNTSVGTDTNVLIKEEVCIKAEKADKCDVMDTSEIDGKLVI